MKSLLVRLQALLTIGGLLALLLPAGSQAATGTTLVTQTVTPGILALTTGVAATMSNATLNGSTTQTTTGNLGLTTVSDARGTGAGWSLTASISNFTRVGVPVHLTGNPGSLTTTGNYTATTSGTYTITIVTGGALGTATYAVSGLETQVATLASNAVALGTHGLSLSFASANYVAGDRWTIDVGTIPASNVTITPSAASTIIGSSSGVTAGSSYTYSGTSDSATLMTASAGNGLGTYTNTPGLSVVVPADAKAGAYVATVTETLN